MVSIGAWYREKSLLEHIWAMSLKIQKLKYTNTQTQQAQIHKNIRGWYREKCWLELLHRQRTEQGSPSSAFNISIQIHEIYVEGHFNILYLMYLYYNTNTSDIEGHFNTNTSDIERRSS